MAESEIDVIVVGAGGAGLAAALSAQEHGARVVLAESEKVVGGATRLSAGMMVAADSSIQRAAGLNDDPARFFHEYMLATQFLLKPGVVKRLVYDSAPTLEWLLELGVRFFPSPMQGGGEMVPRSHVPEGTPGGQQLVDVLHQRCNERGIEIALGNRVEQLLMEDEAVVGARVGGDDFRANAVVLTAGGFGANRERIAEHLPSVDRYGDLVFYVGPDGSRGDALTLAEQAGANMLGYDTSVPILSPRMDSKEFGAYMPGWMLLLGPDGRRACDETAPYGQTYGIVRALGGVVYGLFDADTLAENARLQAFKPDFPEGSEGPPNIYTPESIERLLKTGAVVEGATIQELAQRLGLAGDAVAGSVTRYNDSVERGEDPDFLKPAQFLRPVKSPPFYGIEIQPSTVGMTCFGPEIDADARVLAPTSRPIGGLFAGGECAGGVLGNRYLGSGNSIANAMVFGRTAGRSAAAYSLAGPGGLSRALTG